MFRIVFSVGFWGVVEIILKILMYGVIIGAVIFIITLIVNVVKGYKQKKKEKDEKTIIINHAIADLQTIDNSVLLSVYQEVMKEYGRMKSNSANKALIAIGNKRPDGSMSFFLDLDNNSYFMYKKSIEKEIKKRGL